MVPVKRPFEDALKELQRLRYCARELDQRVEMQLSDAWYWEIKQKVRRILGSTPISWRTVCQLPSQSGKIATGLEQSKIIQRCPFGAFAGMVVTLVPRFRTRPLTIRYDARDTSGAATG